MYCDDKSVEFVVVGHVVAEPGSSTLPQHLAVGFDDVESDGVGCVGFVVAHLMARDYTGIVVGTCEAVDEENGYFFVKIFYVISILIK